MKFLLSLMHGADWSNFLPVFEKGVHPVFEGTIISWLIPTVSLR